MSVIPLTLTISLCLVFTFVLFFVREHGRRHFGSAESEALLPLADETPRVVSATAESAARNHSHDHVCKDGGSCHSCRLHAVHHAVKAAPARSHSV